MWLYIWQTQSCGPDTEEGTCQKGTQICTSGTWLSCQGAVFPQKELCDAKDNDCDGAIDEENAEDCTIFYLDSDNDGYGSTESKCLCSIQDKYSSTYNNDCDDNNPNIHSIVSCTYNGNSCGTFDLCLASCPASPLETCDEIDNNCDGTIDENCECINGETKECGTDIGECQKGTQTCIDGSLSSCERGINSVGEVCDDGLDNDCDGAIDENCNNPGSGGSGSGGRSGSRRTSPPVTTCITNWKCSEWSSCTVLNLRTRTCKDQNNFNTQGNKPEETSACTYQTTGPTLNRCILLNKEINIGSKVGNQYCGGDLQLHNLKPNKGVCEHNYECLNDKCTNNTCTGDYDPIKKILIITFGALAGLIVLISIFIILKKRKHIKPKPNSLQDQFDDDSCPSKYPKNI